MTFDLSGWVESTRRLAGMVAPNFLSQFGYPPGDHVVRGPTDPATVEEARSTHPELPAELLEFYAACSSVSLPDVFGGLFVHSLPRVVAGLEGADPTRVVGGVNATVVVFGSDGGGTLYALTVDGQGVLALPPGPVEDQVYTDSMSPAVRVADGLEDFLTKLEQSIGAFLAGQKFPLSS